MGPDSDFGHTYGGYSSSIVVDENYVVRIPESLDPAAAAPLLCAGITAYAPIARAKVGSSSVVGVIGIGGVGHLCVKIAKAMGAHVVALTASPDKVDDARRLGADEVLLTSDADAMAAARERFDLLLDTVSVPHELDTYLKLVKRQGEMCLLGTPGQVVAAPLGLIFRQKRLTGSFIGGIAETQAALDFCARHNITADIEKIRLDQINEAWARMGKSDVRYRFVIDMARSAVAA
jgi:uncharacterized zinc-type alcohol dehydrogenase-like protein